MTNQAAPEERLPFNWPSFLFVTLSPIIAIVAGVWYISEFGVHPWEIALFFGFYLLSGLGITAGYHRYYSHQTHQCHPLLQVFYLIFGGAALQFSVLDWARNHRIHHRYSDTDRDPHNINKGFWWAHVGWLFWRAPLDDDYTIVKDLAANPLVQWQRRNYWLIVALVTFVLPTLLGALVGRPFGGFLWGCLFRVVLQSHATYGINSFAHTFGRRPHSTQTEARDSLLLSLVAHGEGYHNFHHRFASDYRNGHRWYHWDPSKWLIKTASLVGLSWDLKRAPDNQLLKAKLETDVRRMRERIADLSADVQHAYEERVAAAREQLEKLAQRWHEARLQYREMRRRSHDDWSDWREKLIEIREEFQMAKARWASLIARPALA